MLSTLSLLFDLPVVLKLLTPVGAGETSGTGGTLASIGSTANAAAKAGQILRLVRLARVVSSVKRLEERRTARAPSSLSRSATRRGLMAGTSRHGAGEHHSRLGHKLSDLTTRRVIIGVWCILLASPLFDVKFYPLGNVYSFEARTGFLLCSAMSLHPVVTHVRLARQVGGLRLLNERFTACIAPAAAPGSAPTGILPSGLACTADCLALLDNYHGQTKARLTSACIVRHGLC